MAVTLGVIDRPDGLGSPGGTSAHFAIRRGGGKAVGISGLGSFHSGHQ